MAARRPFWKRHRWKSLGFCLWPPSTCIWSLKLKFQSKLDLCSGNHVVYRQTDGQTDKVNPVYPPSNFVGRGYNKEVNFNTFSKSFSPWKLCCIFIQSLIKSIPNSPTNKPEFFSEKRLAPNRQQAKIWIKNFIDKKYAQALKFVVSNRPLHTPGKYQGTNVSSWLVCFKQYPI